MARARRRTTLGVWLNGRHVGTLTRAASGAIAFAYEAAWLGWEHSFPVSLSLPLREVRYLGDRVLAVFDGLLPDNEEIRRLLAARKGAEGTDAFSLLSEVGRDCVGALQFLPEGEAPGPVGAAEGRAVGEAEIAAILANLGTDPLGLGEDADFRISIAGAQEKTALLRKDGGWLVPHGTSATTHILKPPIARRGDGIDLSQSVENEHLSMTLLGLLGLPVARTAIATFAGRKALVVTRFDRRWTRDGRLLRLPQEDCCQALAVPPSRKYEKDGGPGIAALAELFTGSDDPVADRRRLLRAQIAFWLLAATDGHAKNFSLFLHPGGGYAMTPLYDVMSVQPVLDAGQITRNQMKLAMAVGRNRHYGIDRITPRYFIETGRACGVGEDAVRAIFADLVEVGYDASDEAVVAMPHDFPEALAASIVGGFVRRLAVLERAMAA